MRGSLVSADTPTSSFVIDAGGTPLRIQVRPESRLGVTQGSRTDLFVNQTPGSFVGALGSSTGAISVRGILNGTDVIASRATFAMP